MGSRFGLRFDLMVGAFQWLLGCGSFLLKRSAASLWVAECWHVKLRWGLSCGVNLVWVLGRRKPQRLTARGPANAQ